ncbi:MAG: nicotinamide-nucleotide adenylyltransferase [Thermoplasmata archaeon]
MRGLLIGRFQPFHRGHQTVVQALRKARPEETLLLGIGSAQESFTWKNPFTAGERYEMLERALVSDHVTGWIALPVPDIQRHSLWVSYLESLLPPFQRVYTNNPLTQLLFELAHYAVENPTLVDRSTLEGAHVRARLANGGDWSALVAPPVAAYLREIRAPERLHLLSKGDGAAGDRAEP